MGLYRRGAQPQPQKYHLEIPDQDISDLKELLRLSRLAPKTYENLQTDGTYGVSHEWMTKVKEYWLNEYDWYVHCCKQPDYSLQSINNGFNHAHTVKPRRQREKYINSYPNYKVDIEDDGETFQVHFVALFSKKQDAVPLLMMHGWPGWLSQKPGNTPW